MLTEDRQSPTKSDKSPTSVEVRKASYCKGLCVSPTSTTRNVYISSNLDDEECMKYKINMIDMLIMNGMLIITNRPKREKGGKLYAQ